MAISETPLPLADALKQIHGVTLTEQELRAHVMRPDNVAAAKSNSGPIKEFHLGVHWPPAEIYRVDVDAFTQALHAYLKDSVAGYTMRLHQHGSLIETLEWNWAKEPQDGGEGWNPDVRMHVASCSKVVTTMAMTKLLDAKGIPFSAKIVDHLPGYWSKGQNVDQVTFAHLLTHTSGFHYGGDETPCDFAFMKQQVAAGTTHLGQYSYQNMNFSLCRILLATINGTIPVSFNFIIGGLNDALWDLITLNAYQQYVKANLFGPAGVSDPSFDHQAADALAYNFPVSGNGWNSGNLLTTAGAAGWHMSVDDLLKLMGTFRRGGAVVSPAQAQAMLDGGFGIDITQQTPLGKIYGKNGMWGDGTHLEQSAVYFLPEDMEMAILVNSPVGPTAKWMLGDVANLFADNIKPFVLAEP
jgi:CubicO group peptidase (beta-lactamase class C family)